MGTDLLESSIGERDLCMTISQHCDLVAKKANGTLECSAQSEASGVREVIFPSALPWGGHIRSTGPSAGLPSSRQAGNCWGEPGEGYGEIGAWSISCVRKG